MSIHYIEVMPFSIKVQNWSFHLITYLIIINILVRDIKPLKDLACNFHLNQKNFYHGLKTELKFQLISFDNKIII